MICAEDDSDTTVIFSEDQDLHSFGNSPMDDMDQGYMSPAPAETTEGVDIGESSEVEEMHTLYTEERDVDGDQQATMVVVVDREDVTGDEHEEEAGNGVQTERLELDELDSIEKQLMSMGEGSQSLPTLDTELEVVEESSPLASTLDVNSNRFL